MVADHYKDKVRACFIGKNAGGTLGAPLECKRGVWELTGYTDERKGVLPNDDLDLQLVWLNACEAHGVNVNAEILADYWIAYITGDWSEYGACKNNLRAGLLPPFSGMYCNHNKNSCGAFIRSEIWACLMPGNPEKAVRYALEDAICDHSDEGVYAEIFCTAVESAAFAENKIDELIKIGLSYIPEGCAVAKAVKLVCECFKQNMDWKEARHKLLTEVPCSFGMYVGYEEREKEDIPVGALGFDAPANIGIILIGWLWGNGDFGKSICISAGCGEDADCTAATLGSILGIIGGSDSIPNMWQKPIGDEIKTISVNLTNDVIKIPKTVTELVERIIELQLIFDGQEFKDLRMTSYKTGIFSRSCFLEDLEIRMRGIKKENTLLEVILSYDKPEITDTKQIKLYVRNKLKMQQWIRVRLYTDDGLELMQGNECEYCIDQFHGGTAVSTLQTEIVCNESSRGRYEGVLEITSIGRTEKLYFPILLINRKVNNKRDGMQKLL